tara:strand:- start:9 stop:683 length:675 start_codon:yes stop_codon:yes gene_type:complete
VSSIKLTADSGGGTFEIKAPSSGSNPRVLTLPDAANGNVLTSTSGSSLQVLEQFYLLADGRSVSTSNGTVTTTNVTAQQDLTDSFAEATGSSLTYHPPTGTTEIIYEYKFLIAEDNSNNRYLIGYYLDIDGSEILESRSSRYGHEEFSDTMCMKYSFRVNTGGSNDATTGDRAGLTSMTIKTMIRRWASSYAAKIHQLEYYSGTSAIDVTRRPYVGITAIGVPS